MMSENDTLYNFENSNEIDTPALLIYKDRVVQNIQTLISQVSEISILRPHIKTNKSINICKLMMEQGIKKFKCATIAEVEVLGIAGAEDVLLAYQPTSVKLKRFVKLIQKFSETNFSCLVDNKVTAAQLSEIAVAFNLVISVFIDFNVGMNRTGIQPSGAMELFKFLNECRGLAFKGFHAYDGNIEDSDFSMRIDHCEKEFAPVEKVRKEIEQMGFDFPLLVAGGSPTFAIHAKRKNTECSPGTFVFWDRGYQQLLPEQNFVFAAIVLTRVISLPSEDLICIDLGYKAISSESPIGKRAFFLNDTELDPYSQSEEHLVLKAPLGHNYKIGDEIFVVPWHICPTVAMYNEAHIIENQNYQEKWKIDARGRELSI